MSSIQAKVAEFHKTFGHPVRDGAQPIPTRKEAILALKLVEEEFLELADAMFPGVSEDMEYVKISSLLADFPFEYKHDPNLIEVGDALGDLNVVIHGAALRHGMDMDRIDDAVHRSNMSKLGDDGLPIYTIPGDPESKIVKGPNFHEPDIEGALGL